jgi:hypothetical protein
MEHRTLAVVGNRRHRQRLASGRAPGIFVAAYTELVFGFLIKRFQVIVRERPVRKVRSGHRANK